MKPYVCAGRGRCGGCPLCDEEFAALLKMDSKSYNKSLTARTCAYELMTGSPACRRVERRVAMRTQMDQDEAPPVPDLKARILELRAVAGNAKLRAAQRNGLEVFWPGTVGAGGVPDPPVLRARR